MVSSEVSHELVKLAQQCTDLSHISEVAKPGDNSYDRRTVVSASIQIAKISTRFAFLFKGEPKLEDAKEICAEMKKYVDILVLSSLPSKVSGANYRADIVKAAASISKSVAALAMGLASSDTPKEAHPILVGQVWETCKAVPKCPLTASQAVSRLCQDIRALVLDAKQELDEGDDVDIFGQRESVEEEVGDDGTRRNSETECDTVVVRSAGVRGMMDLIDCALGMLDVCTQIFGDDNAQDEHFRVPKLDILAEHVWDISNAVDEYVASESFGDDLTEGHSDLQNSITRVATDFLATLPASLQQYQEGQEEAILDEWQYISPHVVQVRRLMEKAQQCPCPVLDNQDSDDDNDSDADT